MCDSTEFKELVEKSQQGDDDSLNRLAESARSGLYTYVFRLTMRDELTQDVVQETLLEMFKFLDKLECADRFWPWLRRIAINKIKHHYTREKQRKTVSLSEPDAESRHDAVPDGLTNLVSEELRQIVIDTMSLLKRRYREVLVMRCYEEMDYCQIAEELGCSEFSARVLFFRAKKSLAKQLSRRGLGKGALLTALLIFGKITAPTEAAAAEITIAAAAMQVGASAALVGATATKAVLVPLAAAGMIAVGSVVIEHTPQTAPIDATVSPVATSGQSPSNPSLLTAPANVQQCWYFFPGGESVMMRLLMPDPSSTQSYCLWLQNHLGNYYYDAARHTVHLRNCREWSPSLPVTRLPNDSRALTDFLDSTEGRRVRMDGATAVDSGDLVILTPQGKPDHSSVQVFRHPGLLHEEYFRFGWPADIRMVDERDEMHKRGWTWFTIDGQLAGAKVKGAGCLPFVYDSLKANPPWITLQIDNRFWICDGPDGTYTVDAASGVLTTYPEGTFLQGLARPWAGLHTMDVVRRDAAARRIPFTSRYTAGTNKGQVELRFDKGRVVYTIDMKTDVLDSIAMSFRGPGAAEQKGTLAFTCTGEIDSIRDELTAPKASRYVNARDAGGPLWLLKFAEGTLSR